MKDLRKLAKRVFTDISGILLIISSILFGWLPGPGGIPLFLAGLGLLALNHRWAMRLQRNIQEKGLQFIRKMFSKHESIRALFDLFSAALIFGGIYLLNTYTRNLTLTFAIFSILVGAGLFLGNRERLQKITNFMKR